MVPAAAFSAMYFEPVHTWNFQAAAAGIVALLQASPSGLNAALADG
jgi:hypothetical protein